MYRLRQDFLKQSATRINFIGDKVVAMTLEMYRAPRRMVEEISALGLRHVGYAVPTEMLLGIANAGRGWQQSMARPSGSACWLVSVGRRKR